MPEQRSGGFIHGPWFDGLLLLGAPVLALLAGLLLGQLPGDADRIFVLDQGTTISGLFLKSVIHAHLVIVFFRSHGNARVRHRHPVRFWVVPVVLLVVTATSYQALIAALIISTYWDNIHSSLQTFGIGRIYDMKAGADVEKGRTLDLWLNLLMYFAPFVAGPIWLVIADMFVGLGFHPDHPFIRALIDVQPWFQRALWVVAPALVTAWAWSTWRRFRAGEPLSWQKHVLFVSTAAVSVWAWGYNPFGQALFIVNVFHAVQYFAIVWWSERGSLGQRFGWADVPWGPAATALVLVVAGGLYGFWLAAASDFWATGGWLKRFVLALTNTVALLHFWYDGFIWSVRKKDV